MENKWTQILSHIRENLPDADYSVWISPLKGAILYEKDVPVLDIIACNAFFASYVRSNFITHFYRAATTALQVTGTAPLEIRVREEKSTNAIMLKNISIEELPKKLATAPAVMATAQQLLLPIEQPPVRALNFRYSFDDFVVAPSNRLAHAAAETMIADDAPMEMLFLSSLTGLGKTHLIQSVGQSVLKKGIQRNSNMLYLSAEEFMSQFIMAMKFRHMDEFKARFRTLDLLLLEDVHFLHGKEKTQEELLATIKAIHSKSGRVILTSSFAPKDIVGIDSHLTSLFNSGFIASIEKPDKETRLHILMDKARRQVVTLPEHVAELMANHIKSDIRLLESCLQNLILRSKLLQCPITEDLALEIIGQVAIQNTSLNLESILEMVCKSFTLTMPQLQSSSRRSDMVLARNTAFLLMRKHTDMTLTDIGNTFNRRHSTVTKGIASLEREMSRESSVGRQVIYSIERIEKLCTRAHA